MSRWTHINAIIHIDTFDTLDEGLHDLRMNSFIKTLTKITGSEGNAAINFLTDAGYNVWVDGEEHQTCGCFIIQGDLRDRDLDTVKQELDVIMNRIANEFMIRDGGIFIDDEFGGTMMIPANLYAKEDI